MGALPSVVVVFGEPFSRRLRVAAETCGAVDAVTTLMGPLRIGGLSRERYEARVLSTSRETVGPSDISATAARARLAATQEKSPARV